MATGAAQVVQIRKNMEELKIKFESGDKDGSGKISFKELKEMIKDSSVSDDELQGAFDAIDIDANGWITITEFCEAMNKNSLRNNLAKDFKTMDPHGKGTLSLEEAWKVAEEYGCLLSHEELEAAFTMADRDGDGIITYKKFIEVLTL